MVNAKRKKNVDGKIATAILAETRQVKDPVLEGRDFDFNIDTEIDDDCKDIEENKEMQFIKCGINTQQPTTNNEQRTTTNNFSFLIFN